MVAGCWLLVAGCWLLVAGCWLLVAGCWLLVAGSYQYQSPATSTVLPLAELETLTSLRTTRLLALDGTCVAREKAQVAKFATVRLVELDEGACDREAKRAGLAGVAAAVDVRFDIEATKGVGRHKGLLNGRDV